MDPRDIEIEWDAATYRVYFWSQDGGRCDEHELSGARDVHEVIAWAESNAGDRVPEIFVRHDHPPQHGLIRLAGGRPGTVQVPLNAIWREDARVVIVMPSVRGMLLDEAQAALTNAAVKVSVEPAFVSDVPLRLRVIAQKPEPGTELEPGAEITLTVSPEEDR